MVMTFQTRLKYSRKPTQPRIRFDLEKLNDPTVVSAGNYRWQICSSCYAGWWRCWSGFHGHPLQQGSNWYSRWTSWQAKPEEEVLGYRWDPWSMWPKTRPEEKERRARRSQRLYRVIKRKIRTEMKMAKETWIQGQCQEVEACLRKNNSKKAYQLVKDLTTEKQGKSTTIQDKSGKCLREEWNPLQVDRVLLRSLQLWDWWGPNSTWLPTDTRWRASPYSTRSGGSSSQSAEDGKVSRHG